MRFLATLLLVGSWSAVNARAVAADGSPQPALAALQVGGVDAEGLPAGRLTVDVDVQNGTRSLLVVASASDPRHVVTIQGTQPGAPRRVTFDPNPSTSPAARTASLVVTVSGDDTSTRYVVEVIATIAGRRQANLDAGADPPEPVYLTYDDGPHPVQTPRVLDVLSAWGARATFFVTGERAAAHPDIVERMVAEGHTVANHTWSHRRADSLDASEFRAEVLAAQRQLGPHGTACFRPPGFVTAPYVDAVLAGIGLRRVMADINVRDWQRPGVDELADRIVAGAAPGAIIVLHDGIDRLGGQTAPALDQALSRLAGRGLRFEPVC
jgi:peptidoglycan/xylan/chitin deacetylase (PgdA/CDA1 family)